MHQVAIINTYGAFRKVAAALRGDFIGQLGCRPACIASMDSWWMTRILETRFFTIFISIYTKHIKSLWKAPSHQGEIKVFVFTLNRHSTILAYQGAQSTFTTVAIKSWCGIVWDSKSIIVIFLQHLGSEVERWVLHRLTFGMSLSLGAFVSINVIFPLKWQWQRDLANVHLLKQLATRRFLIHCLRQSSSSDLHRLKVE